MTTAAALISRARQGNYLAVLPELLLLARGGRSSSGPDWEASAASIQILFWCDRFTDAADLAEELITSSAPDGGELCDQDIPFGDAFLAAQLHAGVDAAPRLLRAAESVPAGRLLQESLLWTAATLKERPVVDMLPNVGDWGGEVRSLDGVIGADLVARDYPGLTAREKRVVWEALHEANDFPRARELGERTAELPEQYQVCLWMAGWYAATGEIRSGEDMLLAAHGRWWPYEDWDTIPDSMVLHPTLRQVCTDRVREYYLTRPIGPEAEKAQ
jgi:hypothetical protein